MTQIRPPLTARFEEPKHISEVPHPFLDEHFVETKPTRVQTHIFKFKVFYKNGMEVSGEIKGKTHEQAQGFLWNLHTQDVKSSSIQQL